MLRDEKIKNKFLIGNLPFKRSRRRGAFKLPKVFGSFCRYKKNEEKCIKNELRRM